MLKALILKEANRFTITKRQKIYLILAFVSLIFLFLAVWQAKWIIVEPDAPLGLVSYLPLTYWIAVISMLLVSILAFLDEEVKGDCIFIVILCISVFLLPGIAVFIQQNAGLPHDYYPASEAYTLISEHHIDLANPPTLASYYSWPLIHFITTAQMEITLIKLATLLKYGPLICMLLFTLITYSMGKRLELIPKKCFLLSVLALGSWLPQYAGTFSPRSISILIYLVIMMFIITRRESSTAEVITILLLFSASILIHGLTTLAIFPGLVLVSIYQKRFSYLWIFIISFTTWYMYALLPTFKLGVNEYLLRPFRSIFSALDWQKNPIVPSAAKAFMRYSQITYLLSYVLSMLASIIQLLLSKVVYKYRAYTISMFLWAIGTGALIFGGYGEDIFRTYIFCIVPAAAIIVMVLTNRKMLILLMSVFIVLFPILNYSGTVASGQVLSTELAGNKFLAQNIRPVDYFFVLPGGPRLMSYYEPSLFSSMGMTSVDYTEFANQVDLKKISKFRYVILSKQGSDRWIFYWNEDPYAAWTYTADGQKTDFLYNNNYFAIYCNY